MMNDRDRVKQLEEESLNRIEIIECHKRKIDSEVKEYNAYEGVNRFTYPELTLEDLEELISYMNKPKKCLSK